MLKYGYIYKVGNEIYDPNGKIEESLSDDDIILHNTKLATMEVEAARKKGRATFYILQNKSVGTWDGTYTWPIKQIKTSWHNFAGLDGRRDIWFMIDDQQWYGVNIGDTDIVRAKRIEKSRVNKNMGVF